MDVHPRFVQRLAELHQEGAERLGDIDTRSEPCLTCTLWPCVGWCVSEGLS